jgi:hypothetical protein
MGTAKSIIAIRFGYRMLHSLVVVIVLIAALSGCSPEYRPMPQELGRILEFLGSDSP